MEIKDGTFIQITVGVISAMAATIFGFFRSRQNRILAKLDTIGDNFIEHRVYVDKTFPPRQEVESKLQHLDIKIDSLHTKMDKVLLTVENKQSKIKQKDDD